MPELRKDLITEDWVIIATERGKRPHDFAQPPIEPEPLTCPFCPGNESQTPPELWASRPSGGANKPGFR
jgi:UDPglucose--hexose-1-phosphate uridylyltransferase